MAEPVNGGKNNQAEPPKQISQPPKEMSMEVRLLLVFVLMGAVMFVWQLIYKPDPPPQIPSKNATSAVQSNPAANTSAQPPPAASGATAELTASAPTSPATAQRSEPAFIVDTDLYRITFSNQGAT